MGKYDSKRVLQLGSGSLSMQNIRYIKGNGAYVIAADKMPASKNPYRKHADEVVKLDIDNLDEVIDYCKKKNIDAVVSNGSELSYDTARIINEAIGNSYCHTEKQWKTFVHKDNFRKLCLEHKLDCPLTYYMGNYKDINEEVMDDISLPVIVKPVDSRGGGGISVCFKKEDLKSAIEYAGQNSESSNIIIEEYITGKEVVFTYVVKDSVYKLTASADKYVYRDERNLTVIPELYIYPCADHDLYAQKVNDKVIEMLKSQGLNNCTIFFQTIKKDDHFYFFEAGLRFEGTKTYLITSYYTGQNAYHFYYDTLLKTKTDYDIQLDDPKLNGHVLAMFAIHLRKGRICFISGKRKIKENKKIEQIYYLARRGMVCGESPLSKMYAAYCFEGSNKEELVNQIRFIKKTLKVRDFLFRNMIVDSFDESVLLKKEDENDIIFSR